MAMRLDGECPRGNIRGTIKSAGRTRIFRKHFRCVFILQSLLSLLSSIREITVTPRHPSLMIGRVPTILSPFLFISFAPLRMAQRRIRRSTILREGRKGKECGAMKNERGTRKNERLK